MRSRTRPGGPTALRIAVSPAGFIARGFLTFLRVTPTPTKHRSGPAGPRDINIAARAGLVWRCSVRRMRTIDGDVVSVSLVVREVPESISAVSRGPGGLLQK